MFRLVGARADGQRLLPPLGNGVGLGASSTNQPIFEKYKCVNFPIFAECLGEVPLKCVNFPNFADFSGALARKVSKIWKIDTL